MKPLAPFTDHPASVGETYGQHLAVASGFGWRLLAAGAACLVHALFPFLFERTGSRMVAQLHERMVVSRQRVAARQGRFDRVTETS